MSENKKELDIFEERREQEKEKVQACQTQKQLNSCLQCPEIIGCEIRKKYVVAVYESMNKGAGGGFEF